MEIAAGPTRPRAITPRMVVTVPWRAFHRWRRARMPLVPFFTLVALVIVGIIGPYITPHQAEFGDLYDGLRPPFYSGGAAQYGWVTDTEVQPGQSAFFSLGTDYQGRDILSRMLEGARVTLIVVAIVTVISGSFGVMVGLISGYAGGWVDAVIMRIVDILLALPDLIIALIFVAAVGPSLRNVIIVIVIGAWKGYARLVRGEVLSVKEREYVLGARALGAGNMRIMLRHIFPNVFATVVIVGTLSAGGIVLLEASLSFLGVGVPPPTATWGVMISDGRPHITTAWWVSVIPGFAIFATLFSLNMLGDWLRDYLDPRLRGL